MNITIASGLAVPLCVRLRSRLRNGLVDRAVYNTAKGGVRELTRRSLASTPEEVDAFHISLRTGDRARRKRSVPSDLTSLNEDIADVLQIPAHLLDLPESVRSAVVRR